MRYIIESFGYRHEYRPQSDIIFDARCIANPHNVNALQAKTGQHSAVRDWLLGQPSFGFAYTMLKKEVDKKAEKSTKRIASIAIGCYGGRHRSVALAEFLGANLHKAGHEVVIKHNELKRE